MLLSDVHRDLNVGDEPITMHVRLDELYEVIKRMPNALLEITDTEMKARLPWS